MRLLFFFFQAEDGIRDDLVTGVQTCALPISGGGRGTAIRFPRKVPGKRMAVPLPPPEPAAPRIRSEERRVGKEWRSRQPRNCEQMKEPRAHGEAQTGDTQACAKNHQSIDERH